MSQTLRMIVSVLERSRKLLPVLPALVAGLIAAGCSASKPADDGRRVFDVRGVIQEIRMEHALAIIKHDEIPGYMQAMTMPLTAKNPAELEGLTTNDIVTFKMVVTEDDGWIEDIAKVGVAAAAGTSLPGYRRARIVDALKVGDVMPDYVFTNQLGRAESLAGLKGNAVAITFIFTTCPFPLFCPKMSENFAETQRLLLADRSGPKNWKLWSITIDPETDTPALLRGYAARYKADPARWSHLTGELIDITAIAEQFGLTFWRADGSISHNLRTVVIDAAGRVQAIIPENKWTPEELAAEIRTAAAKR